VTLTPEKGETMRSALERVVDTSGFIGCDFHLHSAPSPDSSIPIEDRVVSLLAEGVEFAIPTDHDHVTDYGPVLDAYDAHAVLGSTPGVEITTRTWGHFIAFPYPKGTPPPVHGGIDPPELFAATRKLAPHAIIQVNHPRMPGVGYFNRGELDAAHGTAAADGFSFEFDTLEVVNGFELTQPNVVAGNITEWMNLLNAGRRFTAVGNSDTHRLFYQWTGYPRTFVRVQDDRPNATNAQEIANALRAGRAVISSGPFVNARVNGSAGPGDIISTDQKTVDLEVVVRAPEWIDVRRAEVYVNGRVVQSARVRGGSGSRLLWQTQVRVERDSWIVVIARGETAPTQVLPHSSGAPFGLTNPIFIDTDGDGAYAPLVQAEAAQPPGTGTRGRSSK
jgi:hypothetical protein